MPLVNQVSLYNFNCHIYKADNYCNMYAYYACFLVSAFAFESKPTIVHVSPMAKSGSKVATVRLWVDEAVLNSSARLYTGYSRSGFVHHNDLGKIIPQSTEDLVLPSVTATEPRSSKEQCIADSKKRYIAFYVDYRLSSKSLFQLGDLNILVSASLSTSKTSYRSVTILKLRVEAGLINSCNSLTH